MPLVHLTISPDKVTEVPEPEMAVLRQQGLILDELPDDAQPPGADETPSPDGQEAGGNPESEES